MLWIHLNIYYSKNFELSTFYVQIFQNELLK